MLEEGATEHAWREELAVDAVIDGAMFALDWVVRVVAWVTRSLLTISPRSLIVACLTRPMGAMTMCGMWIAADG
jgi:hypothetical protein